MIGHLEKFQQEASKVVNTEKETETERWRQRPRERERIGPCKTVGR